MQTHFAATHNIYVLHTVEINSWSPINRAHFIWELEKLVFDVCLVGPIVINYLEPVWD